jgi:hypothetical protein
MTVLGRITTVFFAKCCVDPTTLTAGSCRCHFTRLPVISRRWPRRLPCSVYAENPIEEGSTAVISEIAASIFRISIFAQRCNLQFNHFLVKDDEPLLFDIGLRGMHAEIR